MANCGYTSAQAEEILKKDRILGAALRSSTKLNSVTFKNGHPDNTNLADVFKMASDVGFTFKPGKGFFHINSSNEEVRVGINQIHGKIKEKYSEFTDLNLFDKSNMDDLIAKEKLVDKNAYNGEVSVNHDTINSLDDLKKASIKFIAPAVTPTNHYEFSGRSFYRTTASLGFGIAKGERNQKLENAAAIGNFADELGKRIFGNYNNDTIDYDKVNKFIKDEARVRLTKEGLIDMQQWDIDYKNPVSRDGFDLLVEEFELRKEELRRDYDVKEFHTDYIVWDGDSRVAGEIDILLEQNDGSFRVVDLKTRAKGLQSYDQEEVDQFNDKSKHTMQTNKYSNMMASMGFKMEAPLIIMAHPQHPTDPTAVINNTSFHEMEGGRYSAIIQLPRREHAVASFAKDKTGRLKAYYKDKTQAYNDWLAAREAGERTTNAGGMSISNKAKQRLQDKLRAIKEGLESFKNMSKRNSSANALSEDLEDVITALDVASSYALDENLLKHQIIIAGNFFTYAANQLNELHTVMQNQVGNNKERLERYVQIRNYAGVFKTAQDLFSQLESMRKDLGVEELVEFQNIKEEFKQFAAINANFKTDQDVAIRTLFYEMITESHLGSKGEIKENNRLQHEAEELYDNGELSDENGTPYSSKAEAVKHYINKAKSTAEYKEKVLDAYYDEIDTLINEPSRDMSKVTFMLNSDMMVNNDYIKLYNKMLINSEQKYSTIANKELIALSKKHAELQLTRAEQEELITWDEEGNAFLLGDYSIEYYTTKTSFNKRIRAITRELGSISEPAERTALEKESIALSTEYTKWLKDNTTQIVLDKSKEYADNVIKLTSDIAELEEMIGDTTDPVEADAINEKLIQKNSALTNMLDEQKVNAASGTKVTVPIEKWKTDKSQLSDRQLEGLQIFKDITDLNESRIGRQSLKKSTYQHGAYFYKLPGMLRTGYGHVVRGNLMAAVKKEVANATKIELGDTEEGQNTDDKGNVRMAYTGLDGKPTFYQPIFYRSSPKDMQNTDLFTIYAMELENGIRYMVDSELNNKATLFMDAAKNSEFFAQVGIERSYQRSVYAPKDSKVVDTIQGEASVVIKMIEKMTKARVYSITQEYGGKVGNKDINRIISTISSYTTFASMSFRTLSAGNNWVTGNVSVALEAAGGEFWSVGTLAKAKAAYMSNIGGIMVDMGTQVKQNKVNQLLHIFDVMGDRSALDNEFERTNKVTQLLKTGTSLSTYAMGEHEIHATIMLAVLINNKILDKNGNYLSIGGEVVESREDAASLYDAFEIGEDGVYSLAKWAHNSEFDTLNELSEDGLAGIRGLIKDRATRTQGAFDDRMKAELNRHWYGKLFFQFKKHMPPQFLNRFRGMNKSNVRTADILDEDKFFNINTKTEEYGYYTSFIRLLLNTAKTEKFNIMGYMKEGKNEWKAMSVHERANVTKTITELSFITMLALMAGAAAAADDFDWEALGWLVYLMRRQVNEAGWQYLNPMENWRVVQSPMAAIGKLQNISDTLLQLYNPDELYDSGDYSGESKLKKKAGRAFILGSVLDQFNEGHTKKIYNNLSR